MIDVVREYSLVTLVHSGVADVAHAQIVQRPNSPHASEVEPSVDEV